MATVPTTATKAVGDKTSANWANNNVKTPIDWDLTNKPILYLSQTVAQSGWTSSTPTAVTFSAETAGVHLDRDGQHDTVTNNTRVVIGNTLGWYRVSGVYAAAANSVTTQLRVWIGVNGTKHAGSFNSFPIASGTGGAQAVATPTVYIKATTSTDYIELLGYQTAASGTIGTNVAADVASSLSVEWVGN